MHEAWLAFSDEFGSTRRAGVGVPERETLCSALQHATSALEQMRGLPE